MIATKPQSPSTHSPTWQEGFLQLLPIVEATARVTFRDLDPEAFEDAVSDVVANAMCAYRRLHERGELQRVFASVLVRYAAAQYRAGRRVGSSQSTRDVYSPQARTKAGCQLCSIGAPGEQDGEWRECLVDDRFTPIPDQVAFRIDFPCWLDSQSSRDKRVAERLSLGYSTGEVACEFEVSKARISQLRRELDDSWHEFIEDTAVQDTATWPTC